VQNPARKVRFRLGRSVPDQRPHRNHAACGYSANDARRISGTLLNLLVGQNPKAMRVRNHARPICFDRIVDNSCEAATRLVGKKNIRNDSVSVLADEGDRILHLVVTAIVMRTKTGRGFSGRGCPGCRRREISSDRRVRRRRAATLR